MSIFSFFGPSIKYSQHEHPLPTIDLKHMLSAVHIRSGSTVSDADRDLAFEAIEARRGGDGKISLQQIYEVLNHFKQQHQITKNDFSSLMNAFVQYYGQHFND